MRNYRICIAILGLVAMVLTASPASAQDDLDADSLTVKKTYIRVATSEMYLDTEDSDAFLPATINCPGNTSCVLHVQVDMMWGGQNYGFTSAPLYVKVAIDGQPMAPSLGIGYVTFALPLDVIELNYTRSFTWAQEIAPGQHTIAVNARATVNNEIVLGPRTATISVFK